MAKKELLWVQLARDLAYAIATGRYPVGTLLPKELDICRKTGLSRYTVRAALDHLQRTGLIKRTPHVGTEVVARGAARGPRLCLSAPVVQRCRYDRPLACPRGLSVDSRESR